jgi:hypothetical protein
MSDTHNINSYCKACFHKYTRKYGLDIDISEYVKKFKENGVYAVLCSVCKCKLTEKCKTHDILTSTDDDKPLCIKKVSDKYLYFCMDCVNKHQE